MSDTRTKAVLTKKMQAAIREQLPEEISAMLRQRLEQADDAIADNKVLAAEIDHLRERTETARTLNKREEMLDARDADLLLKGVELDTGLRDLELKKMTYQLAAQRSISDALQVTLHGLVRNTEYRKEVFGTTPDPSGQYLGATASIGESGTYTAE